MQQITSIGEEELVFLAIVDPAWRPEDQVILYTETESIRCLDEKSMVQ